MATRMNGDHRGLARRAWAFYPSSPAVVRPSIPILWFGDSCAYARSPLRIATVGLNPSKEEFPPADPFLPFPRARDIGQPEAVDGRSDDYRDALDAYFTTEPYRRWFDQGFERILHGLDASYYPGRPNMALHTDICSPLATDPTWGNLPRDHRARLAADGAVLWRDLVRYLLPDG